MNQKHLFCVVLLGMILLAAGCGPTAGHSPAVPSPAPSITAAPTSYPTPDLSTRPLVWFAPLPPLLMDAGRQFIGAEDYMDLFQPGAPWQKATRHINVFKLYAEWAGDASWTIHASDQELRQVIDFVKRNGIALAMEDGPIKKTGDCGSGFESWGGLSSSMKIARRIQSLGGTLSFIAMDEPYYQFSLLNSPGACQWPAEKVAMEIDAYIKGMKTVFPELVIGDIEPLQPDSSPTVYMNWMTTFRQAAGYNLPFFHMDINYTRLDWPEQVKKLEDFARRQGIDFGIIYFGNWSDLTDEAWLSSAGERVKRYELEIGSQPDQVVFQSWHDHPDYTLPETKPYTFTNFIDQYFENKAGLGFRRAGPGANVAFGKTAHASRFLSDWPPSNAVDGNPDSVWNAGDFPPNWIEVDLGQPYAISEIRLLLEQGQLVAQTIHRIYVRGPGTDNQLILLHTFEGETSTLDQLVYKSPEPLEGIQFVRAEITRSPSWVAFRELEVISAR